MKLFLQLAVILALAFVALYFLKVKIDADRDHCDQQKGFYFKGKCLKDGTILD